MLDSVLFVVLPYVAIVVCLLGIIWQVRQGTPLCTASSGQAVEYKSLLWGWFPWHICIALVLLGHLVAFCFPVLWQSLVAQQYLLLSQEIVGAALGIACLFALVIIAARWLISSRLQELTSEVDLFVLGLLLAQVMLGVSGAFLYRWGSAWSIGTTTPYLWSILCLEPNTSYVVSLPIIVRAHVVVAWLLLALVPFSKSIYLWLFSIVSLPQQLFAGHHGQGQITSAEIPDETRRHFLKGIIGVAFGMAMFSLAALYKTLCYLSTPSLTRAEQVKEMKLQVARLESTAKQRSLELEREVLDYITVANLSELSPVTGKYFIDYQMRPAMAFLGFDGLPNLLSAKCTHLGCTVGNQVDNERQIVCPCHMSYFNVTSGIPTPASPAKLPLPHIGWVLKDKDGKIIASRTAGGVTTGSTTSADIKDTIVCIAKDLEVQAS